MYPLITPNLVRRIASVAILFACSIAFGRAYGRDLVELETPYFTVVSALSESDTRAIVDEIRVLQAVITSFSTIRDLRPQVPLRIYLLNATDWEKYFRISRTVAARYKEGTFKYIVALDAQRWNLASTSEGPSRSGATVEAQSVGAASEFLFKGYVTFVLRNADNNTYPSWFEQGLSQMLSTIKLSKNKVIVGLPPLGRLEDLDRPGGAHWVPLQRVLEMRPESVPYDEKNLADRLGFTVQSWALLHYIMFEHPEGAKALSQYLASIREGAAIDAAFSKSFGMSVTEMESKLKAYTQRTAYKNLSADTTKLPLTPTDSYQLRRLNPADSAVELSSLIVQLDGSNANAEAFLDESIKSHPNDPRLTAVKAKQLAAEKEFDKADSLIKQALQAGATQPSILDIAGGLQLVKADSSGDNSNTVSAERQAKAIEYFDAAIENGLTGLDELEAVATLAKLALDSHASLERPLVRIVRVRQKYPNEPHVAALQAQLLTALQRPAEARNAWQVVARFGQGPLRNAALSALGTK